MEHENHHVKFFAFDVAIGRMSVCGEVTGVMLTNSTGSGAGSHNEHNNPTMPSHVLPEQHFNDCTCHRPEIKEFILPTQALALDFHDAMDKLFPLLIAMHRTHGTVKRSQHRS